MKALQRPLIALQSTDSGFLLDKILGEAEDNRPLFFYFFWEGDNVSGFRGGHLPAPPQAESQDQVKNMNMFGMKAVNHQCILIYFQSL